MTDKKLDRMKTFAMIRRIAEKNPDTVRLYQENEVMISDTVKRIPDILTAVAVERARQEKKWGIQELPDVASDGFPAGDWERMAELMKKEALEFPNGMSWKSVLLEEVAEAFAETDPDKIVEELIQVAAVCVSWIEALANRDKGTR